MANATKYSAARPSLKLKYLSTKLLMKFGAMARWSRLYDHTLGVLGSIQDSGATLKFLIFHFT